MEHAILKRRADHEPDHREQGRDEGPGRREQERCREQPAREAHVARVAYVGVGSRLDHAMSVVRLDAHRLLEERIHDHGPSDKGPSEDKDGKAQQPRCPQRARDPVACLDYRDNVDCDHYEPEQHRPHLVPGLCELAEAHAPPDQLGVPPQQARQVDGQGRDDDAHVDPAERPAQPSREHEDEPHDNDDHSRDSQADEGLQHRCLGVGALLNVRHFGFLLVPRAQEP